MKLTGRLKTNVAKASSKEEARSMIAKAGMELTMDELEIVTGGVEGGNGYIYDGTLDGWTETSPGSGLYTDGNGNYVSPVSYD